MLSDNNFSRACRRIREHMTSIVPAMIQKNPQPTPTIVLATEDLKHTLSVVDSLRPIKKNTDYLERGRCSLNYNVFYKMYPSKYSVILILNKSNKMESYE